MPGLIIDNFAGAGGASLGIEAAMGRPVDVAINHSPTALRTHALNHPRTKHLCGDIWDYKPLEVTGGRPVDLMWASPDCKHFSRAKGGRPVSQRVRGLAWVVIRWARQVRPTVIVLENVAEFQTWGPLIQAQNTRGKPLFDGEGRRVMLPDKSRAGDTFRQWVSQLRRCGYAVEWRELVAADYGVPTIRKRLFLIARCDVQPITWPARTHAPRKLAAGLGLPTWRPAADCIDWDLRCPSIFERKRPLAAATLRRIAAGMARFVFGAAEPFVVCCNHGDHGGDRCRSLFEPSPTITAACDAYGLVTPLVVNCANSKRTLTTATTGGHHAFVAAFLSHLVKLRGTCKDGQPVTDPMPTITAGGMHVADVRAFLIAYYTTRTVGSRMQEPVPTINTKDRLGLVTIRGQKYQVSDIGMRMLQPAELLRAQFGRLADRYQLCGTQAQQIAGIGNSVCPELAEALVRSNCVPAAQPDCVPIAQGVLFGAKP
jgi:DNA (cytosine-5)-methyltransferase 1